VEFDRPYLILKLASTFSSKLFFSIRITKVVIESVTHNLKLLSRWRLYREFELFRKYSISWEKISV